MSEKADFSVADFIRKTKATKPNGWKQVNDVQEGEIVLLAGQPCEVDDLEAWWAGKPGRSDGIMEVTGFSLTQDKEVKQTFKMWTEIPIFIGEPKKCDYVVIGLQGNTLQLSELNNTSLPLPLDITKETSVGDIRQLFNEGKRVVVRVKSFLEIRRIVQYNGIPENPE